MGVHILGARYGKDIKEGYVMRKVTIPVVLALMLLTLSPLVSDGADAASSTVESRRVIITNVYGSTFTSLGTLDESEHLSLGLYFFIEGSERHSMFLRYLDGSCPYLPNDDWRIITEGSNVHAYFFDKSVYDDWHTLVTFETTSGIPRFLSVGFQIERPVDALSFFFMKDSTAEISWVNQSGTPIQAFFNDIQLKDEHSTVKIDSNCSCVMKFLIYADDNATISATVSYTVSGFDGSDAMPIGTVCWVLFLLVMAYMVLVHRGPKWSGKGGLK